MGRPFANRVIEAFGQRRIASDWAARSGIARTTILERLRAGWAPEDAVSIRPGRRPGATVGVPGGDDPQHNFIVAQVAQAFAAADAVRMRELDRLCKSKYSNTDPRDIPGSVLHPEKAA